MGEVAHLVLGCDVDGTLVPEQSRPPEEQAAGMASLEELCEVVESSRQPESSLPRIYFGSVTGRTWKSHEQYAREVPGFAAAVNLMDFTITGVGSEIRIRRGGDFVPLKEWPVASQWERPAIEAALLRCPELALQEPLAQTHHKLSFDILGEAGSDHDKYLHTILVALGRIGAAAEVIISGGRYLDVLPKGVHKGSAFLRAAGVVAPATAVHAGAGDTMNDAHLLGAVHVSIVPGNAAHDFKVWAGMALPGQRLHIAKARHAGGILEGLSAAGLIP